MLEEDDSTGAARQYTYGLDLISRWDTSTGKSIYYVKDGHGSVRALTDQNGAVTDTYDYDAFGNLIHSTGTTPNNYLYTGEQFDPDLNLYYNRARYLNASTGRFWSMDTFDGDDESPLSLHKYLYVGAEPVDERDPSGHGFEDTLTSVAIQAQLFVSAHPILTAVMTGVLLSLAPPEVSESFSFMSPEVQLIGEVEAEAKELTTIRRLLKSNWLDKFQAGSKFESWMLNRILANTEKDATQLVVKDGEALAGKLRPLGSAVIDAIIKGIVMEFKTSFGAVSKYQAQQFAKYSEKNGSQLLEYVFLYKPTPQQINTLQGWVKEAGPNVKLAVTYILGN